MTPAVVGRSAEKPIVDLSDCPLLGPTVELSRHNDLAKAMDYILKRWDAFTRFLDDGRVCPTRALGLSSEAQDKLVELVDGRGARSSSGGRRLRWATIGDLGLDLMTSRRNDLLLGPKVADELRSNLVAASVETLTPQSK
jgi:hypothetical protein